MGEDVSSPAKTGQANEPSSVFHVNKDSEKNVQQPLDSMKITEFVKSWAPSLYSGESLPTKWEICPARKEVSEFASVGRSSSDSTILRVLGKIQRRPIRPVTEEPADLLPLPEVHNVITVQEGRSIRSAPSSPSESHIDAARLLQAPVRHDLPLRAAVSSINGELARSSPFAAMEEHREATATPSGAAHEPSARPAKRSRSSSSEPGRDYLPVPPSGIESVREPGRGAFGSSSRRSIIVSDDDETEVEGSTTAASSQTLPLSLSQSTEGGSLACDESISSSEYDSLLQQSQDGRKKRKGGFTRIPLESSYMPYTFGFKDYFRKKKKRLEEKKRKAEERAAQPPVTPHTKGGIVGLSGSRQLLGHRFGSAENVSKRTSAQLGSASAQTMPTSQAGLGPAGMPAMNMAGASGVPSMATMAMFNLFMQQMMAMNNPMGNMMAGMQMPGGMQFPQMQPGMQFPQMPSGMQLPQMQPGMQFPQMPMGMQMPPFMFPPQPQLQQNGGGDQSQGQGQNQAMPNNAYMEAFAAMVKQMSGMPAANEGGGNGGAAPPSK